MQVTAVGYAGGSEKSPTYHDIGGHTESFQLIYDPKVITFEKLLDVFWAEHNPFRQGWSTQYQNIAFYENDSQRKAIERHVKKLEKGGREVVTRVEPLRSFTFAEDYHQKHSLRMFPEFVETLGRSAGDPDWIFTRVATKLNAYLGNHGSCDKLEKEVRGFGLPSGLEDELLGIVCQREGRKGEACQVPAR